MNFFDDIAARVELIMDLQNQRLITKKEAIMLLSGYKLEVITSKLGKLFYNLGEDGDV